MIMMRSILSLLFGLVSLNSNMLKRFLGNLKGIFSIFFYKDNKNVKFTSQKIYFIRF